jgi:hypothetical protein
MFAPSIFRGVALAVDDNAERDLVFGGRVGMKDVEWRRA